MKFCVYGLGAVGGLLGGKLAAAGFNVSALARGQAVDTVRRDGLKLVCEGKTEVVPMTISSKPEDLGTQDVVIITVKNTQIESVAEGIAPLMHEGTVVLSAMNGVPWWFYHGLKGVNAEKPIESVDPNGFVSHRIPHSRVVGCVSNLSSSMRVPGVVEHKPNPKFTVGEPTGGFSSERSEAILEAMQRAGLDAQGSESIQQTIWFKLWGNMTVNPISAMTGCTSDLIVGDPLVRSFMARCMQEAKTIGSRIGIEMDSTPEARFEATRKLGVFKTSMLQDAEGGRGLELDALIGSVREIAADVGVETPNIDALFGLARLHARRHGLYPV